MEIVEAKIKDRYLTKLIWKALRAGYLEEEAETIQHSIAGTPQGSIITPILANVYLDQLDRYVEALAKEFDNGLPGRTLIRPGTGSRCGLTQRVGRPQERSRALRLRPVAPRLRPVAPRLRPDRPQREEQFLRKDKTLVVNPTK